MINLTCYSDTHNQHFSNEFIPKLNPDATNIMIHAGDFTVKGTPGEIHSFSQWIEELYHSFKAIIFVAGNHDKMAEQDPPRFRNFFQHLPNVHYLQNSGVTIEGIRFWGSPNTQRFFNWAFMDEEDDLKHYWDMIPDDTDVLITHSPPFGILDRCRGQNLGSPSLADKVKIIKPKYHLFGHIHPGVGNIVTKDTTYVNLACLDDRYDIQSGPTYIRYKE